MKRLIFVTSLLPLAIAANAEEVCVDYLIQHFKEQTWKDACISWLESNEQGGTGGGSAAMMQMQSCPPTPQKHVFDLVFSQNQPLAENNQREPFIAVDPSPGNAGRAFVLAITAPEGNGTGFLSSRTSDSGQSWESKRIGNAANGPIPAALADPWAIFTDHETLFIAYLYDNSLPHPMVAPMSTPSVVAMSTDGGDIFSFVDALGEEISSSNSDRPSLATGPGGAHGTLWLMTDAGTNAPIVVYGAALDSQGEISVDACGPSLGSFCEVQDISGAPGFRPGHLAIGPAGEVLATFLRPVPGTPGVPGTTEVFAVTDLDGLGPATFPDPEAVLGGLCPPMAPSGMDCIYPVVTTNVFWGLEDFPPREPRMGPQHPSREATRPRLPGDDERGTPGQRRHEHRPLLLGRPGPILDGSGYGERRRRADGPQRGAQPVLAPCGSRPVDRRRNRRLV